MKTRGSSFGSAGFAIVALVLGVWCGVRPAAATLVGYWNFDVNGTGDSSGNSYNGTLAGNAARVTDDKVLGAGSLVLDGVGDYLQLPRGSLSNPGDLIRKWKNSSDAYTNNAATLSIWVKLVNASPPSHWGFVGLDQAGLANWGVDNCYTYSDGVAYLGVFGTGRFAVFTPSASVNRAQWHQVTITSDPANGWNFYQNGKLVHHTTQNTFGLDCYQGFTVGVGLGDYLAGHVDDVALFDRGLSSNKVAAS